MPVSCVRCFCCVLSCACAECVALHRMETTLNLGVHLGGSRYGARRLPLLLGRGIEWVFRTILLLKIRKKEVPSAYLLKHVFRLALYNDVPSKPKPTKAGNSDAGLGLRNKVRLG